MAGFAPHKASLTSENPLAGNPDVSLVQSPLPPWPPVVVLKTPTPAIAAYSVLVFVGSKTRLVTGPPLSESCQLVAPASDERRTPWPELS